MWEYSGSKPHVLNKQKVCKTHLIKCQIGTVLLLTVDLGSCTETRNRFLSNTVFSLFILKIFSVWWTNICQAWQKCIWFRLATVCILEINGKWQRMTIHRYDARNQKIVELDRTPRVKKRNIGMRTGEEKLSGHGDNQPLMAVMFVRRLILRWQSWESLYRNEFVQARSSSGAMMRLRRDKRRLSGQCKMQN